MGLFGRKNEMPAAPKGCSGQIGVETVDMADTARYKLGSIVQATLACPGLEESAVLSEQKVHGNILHRYEVPAADLAAARKRALESAGQAAVQACASCPLSTLREEAALRAQKIRTEIAQQRAAQVRAEQAIAELTADPTEAAHARIRELAGEPAALPPVQM
ncbi:MAG TPA: hypothetical protein VLF91_00080 [Candidatus Saccharimonadales bacterium]|nr:hypothetical protein [Candidatus Saccharimonadales bacterium]